MHPRHIFSRVKTPAKSPMSKSKFFNSTSYHTFKDHSLNKTENIPFAFSIIKPIKIINKYKFKKAFNKGSRLNNLVHSNKLSPNISFNSTTMNEDKSKSKFSSEVFNDDNLPGLYLGRKWEPKLEIRSTQNFHSSH